MNYSDLHSYYPGDFATRKLQQYEKAGMTADQAEEKLRGVTLRNKNMGASPEVMARALYGDESRKDHVDPFLTAKQGKYVPPHPALDALEGVLRGATDAGRKGADAVGSLAGNLVMQPAKQPAAAAGKLAARSALQGATAGLIRPNDPSMNSEPVPTTGSGIGDFAASTAGAMAGQAPLGLMAGAKAVAAKSLAGAVGEGAVGGALGNAPYVQVDANKDAVGQAGDVASQEAQGAAFGGGVGGVLHGVGAFLSARQNLMDHPDFKALPPEKQAEILGHKPMTPQPGGIKEFLSEPSGYKPDPNSPPAEATPEHMMPPAQPRPMDQIGPGRTPPAELPPGPEGTPRLSREPNPAGAPAEAQAAETERQFKEGKQNIDLNRFQELPEEPMTDADRAMFQQQVDDYHRFPERRVEGAGEPTMPDGRPSPGDAGMSFKYPDIEPPDTSNEDLWAQLDKPVPRHYTNPDFPIEHNVKSITSQARYDTRRARTWDMNRPPDRPGVYGRSVTPKMPASEGNGGGPFGNRDEMGMHSGWGEPRQMSGPKAPLPGGNTIADVGQPAPPADGSQFGAEHIQRILSGELPAASSMSERMPNPQDAAMAPTPGAGGGMPPDSGSSGTPGGAGGPPEGPMGPTMPPHLQGLIEDSQQPRMPVNPVEIAANHLREGIASHITENHPEIGKRLGQVVDGMAHLIISKDSSPRTAEVLTNKYYHGPLEAVWDSVRGNAPQLLGLDPVTAEQLKGVIQGDVVYSSLAPDQQAKLADAIQKATPLEDLIRAGSDYMIQSERLGPDVPGNAIQTYIRRHLMMFDPATRDSFVPPAGSREAAAQSLVSGEGMTLNQAHDLLDQIQNGKQGDNFRLPNGDAFTLGTDILKRKNNFTPEMLRWMGEVNHGGWALLRTLGDMAPNVHLARTSDAIFVNMSKIMAESPNEPMTTRPLADELGASKDQRTILGELGRQRVPRSVAEMYQNLFSMQDGHYRIANNWLKAMRYGFMGLQPSVHSMWAMNDAYAMYGAGANPMNPANLPHIAKALKAVAAYHLEDHPLLAKAFDKIPGFDHDTFVAENKPEFQRLQKAGAFRNAGKLRGEAMYPLAEFLRAQIAEQSKSPGAVALNLLTAPQNAVDYMGMPGKLLRMGPEIMEGTSQVMQMATVLKAENGIRLKDFGPVTKMSTDDAILHKNDFFYDSAGLAPMLRGMRTGLAGALNQVRGMPGIGYNTDVASRMLPNTLKAMKDRPLSMAAPILGLAALHHYGWAMGGWAHEHGGPLSSLFITPEAADAAEKGVDEQSYKYKFPHGIWAENPFAAPFHGKPSMADMAGGMPWYFLANYQHDPLQSDTENMNGYLRQTFNTAFVGAGNFAQGGDTSRGESLGRDTYMSQLINQFGNTGGGHFIRDMRDVSDALSGAPMDRFHYEEGPTRTMLRTLGNVNMQTAEGAETEGAKDRAGIKSRLKGAARAIIIEGQKRGQSEDVIQSKLDRLSSRIEEME